MPPALRIRPESAETAAPYKGGLRLAGGWLGWGWLDGLVGGVVGWVGGLGLFGGLVGLAGWVRLVGLGGFVEWVVG